MIPAPLSTSIYVAAALCVSVGVDGCSGTANSNVATGRFALSLPAGSEIGSVSYRVLSSGNVTLAAATVDVSDRNATLSLDLVLAPGIGDVVELSARTSAGASCSGTSAPFDVVAGQPIFVDLTLVCGGARPDSGSCPDIQSWSVTPVQAAVPAGTLSVEVTASAPTFTDALVFAWSATAGSFGDSSAASTLYTCTTLGTQTLTLTVRDGQSPSDPSGCAATATFLVSCVPGADAGVPP